MSRYVKKVLVRVSNLSFETTDDEFRQFIVDKGFYNFDCFIFRGNNGISKGCGFVKLETEEDENSAIEKIDNSFYQNRRLKATKIFFTDLENELENI